MISEVNGWQCLVTDDFPSMGVAFQLAWRRDRRTDFVTEISADTTLLSVDEGEAGPRSLKLSKDAARALRLALDAHFGDAPNDYRARYEEARDALVVERARVDQLLGVLTRQP